MCSRSLALLRPRGLLAGDSTLSNPSLCCAYWAVIDRTRQSWQFVAGLLMAFKGPDRRSNQGSPPPERVYDSVAAQVGPAPHPPLHLERSWA